MRIAKKFENMLADEIEAALDYFYRFDSLPFNVKREAAVKAAAVAIAYLRGERGI